LGLPQPMTPHRTKAVHSVVVPPPRAGYLSPHLVVSAGRGGGGGARGGGGGGGVGAGGGGSGGGGGGVWAEVVSQRRGRGAGRAHVQPLHPRLLSGGRVGVAAGRQPVSLSTACRQLRPIDPADRWHPMAISAPPSLASRL